MNGSGNVSNPSVSRPGMPMMPTSNYNNEILSMMNQSKGPGNYQGLSMMDRVSTPPTSMTNSAPPQSPSKPSMPSFDSEFPLMGRSINSNMPQNLTKNDPEFNFEDFPALPGSFKSIIDNFILLISK
jgi:hypothetical protein